MIDAETLVELCKREPHELITLSGRQIHPFSILQYPEQEQLVQANILLADLQLQANFVDFDRYQCPCGKGHIIVPDPQMTIEHDGLLWDVRCYRRAHQ